MINKITLTNVKKITLNQWNEEQQYMNMHTYISRCSAIPQAETEKAVKLSKTWIPKSALLYVDNTLMIAYWAARKII